MLKRFTVAFALWALVSPLPAALDAQEVTHARPAISTRCQAITKKGA
jgi:hypothetical protein